MNKNSNRDTRPSLPSIRRFVLGDANRKLRELAAQFDIRQSGARHHRAKALYHSIKNLAEVRAITGFDKPLLFCNGRAYVKQQNVWLDSLVNQYYLRSNDLITPAIELSEMFSRRGRDLEVCLDIGAFVGEVSLWISSQFPSSSIHAIEAGTEAYSALKGALLVQDFPCNNVRLHKLAIGASDGTAEFSTGKGTQNSLVANGETFESVRMVTLETFLRENLIEKVDFAKIDIEGAEPMLNESLLHVAGIFGLMFIEFSIFGQREGYLQVANTLLMSGMKCETSSFEPLASIEEVGEFLTDNLDRRGRTKVDLWFLRS